MSDRIEVIIIIAHTRLPQLEISVRRPERHNCTKPQFRGDLCVESSRVELSGRSIAPETQIWPPQFECVVEDSAVQCTVEELTKILQEMR